MIFLSILGGLLLGRLSIIIPEASTIWLRNSSDIIGFPLKATELLTRYTLPIYSQKKVMSIVETPCPLWLYLFRKRPPLKSKYEGLFFGDLIKNPCSFKERDLVNLCLFYLINVGYLFRVFIFLFQATVFIFLATTTGTWIISTNFFHRFNWVFPI